MSTRLIYPLSVEAPVMQSFGDNPRLYGRFGFEGHTGIDLGVYTGTPVKAMADGVIRFSGPGVDEQLMGSGAGMCVLLDHGDILTGYAHLLTAYGEVGEAVKAGEVIGVSGATGAVAGDHLHIEVLELPLALSNGYLGRVDPSLWMKRGTPLYKARRKAVKAS